MTDEEYVFRQTEVERKKLGYGDKHKKRGGGRYVRLPSDNLTKKERDAMNGECITYAMTRPVTLAEMEEWPKDIQRQYLQDIIRRYRVPQKQISTMLGCGVEKTRMVMIDLGVFGRHRGGKQEPMDKEGWAQFMSAREEAKTEQEAAEIQQEPEDEPDTVETVAAEARPEETVSVEVKPKKKAKPAEKAQPVQKAQKADLHNIALLLQSLAGTGAKLTIEVTL